MRFQYAVCQRDPSAGALTEGSRSMQALAQQIPAWVAGKMTAVLQVTDTDVAFRLEVASWRVRLIFGAK